MTLFIFSPITQALKTSRSEVTSSVMSNQKADNHVQCIQLTKLILSPPGSASSAVRGSWLESSSIHSSLHTPALTSTVQRQPAKPTASKKPRHTESDIGRGLIEPESEDEFSSGYV